MATATKTRAKAISFDASSSDSKVILKIAQRAVEQARKASYPPAALMVQDWAMDVTAVHCNGCPLRLMDLFMADDFNFCHDVFGIRRFLDRTTGEMGGHFLPRFAVGQ